MWEGFWMKDLRYAIIYLFNIKVSGKVECKLKVTFHYHNFYSALKLLPPLEKLLKNPFREFISIRRKMSFVFEKRGFIFVCVCLSVVSWTFASSQFNALQKNLSTCSEGKTLCHFDGLSHVVNFIPFKGWVQRRRKMEKCWNPEMKLIRLSNKFNSREFSMCEKWKQIQCRLGSGEGSWVKLQLTSGLFT